MKIYVVTTGGYSEYSIDSLFSTKKLAQDYIDLHEGSYTDFNDIEEYELDSELPRMQTGLFKYDITMTKTGNVDKIAVRPVLSKTKNSFNIWAILGVVKLYCTIITKSKEHAIKIANDTRVQLIANNQWERGYSSDDGVDKSAE